MKFIPDPKFTLKQADINKDAPFKAKLRFPELALKQLSPSTTIAVYFKLNTGDEEFHIVKVQAKKFKVYKKTYFADSKYLTYNRTLGMFMGTYHEDISLPIKQVINVNELKDGVNNKPQYATVKSNINPDILTEYAKSKVIQDTLNGHALTSVMGFLKIFAIITFVLGVLHFVLTLWASVVFSKLIAKQNINILSIAN